MRLDTPPWKLRFAGSAQTAGAPPAGVDLARSFNGSSNLIQQSQVTPTNFDFNQPFSVFGWFNFQSSTLNNEQSLIGHLDPSSNFIGWELHKENNSLSNLIGVFLINSFPVTSIQAQSDFGPSASTWYHIGFTYDGSGVEAGIKMYVNGTLRTNTLIHDSLGGTTTTNTLPVRIGMRSNGTIPFGGSAADIAAWNVTLNATQISNLAGGQRANTIGANANLVDYLPILGQSPEPDMSGNGNNGVLTGTTVVPGPPTLNLF